VRKIPGIGGGTITVNAIRTGRGQVGPCLTDEAHRPLPERHSHVSRYAGARILQQRSLRRIFAGGAMLSPLLRTNAIVGPQLKLCRSAQSVKVLHRRICAGIVNKAEIVARRINGLADA
jgi:hypothetical protein